MLISNTPELSETFLIIKPYFKEHGLSLVNSHIGFLWRCTVWRDGTKITGNRDGTVQTAHYRILEIDNGAITVVRDAPFVGVTFDLHDPSSLPSLVAHLRGTLRA